MTGTFKKRTDGCARIADEERTGVTRTQIRACSMMPALELGAARERDQTGAVVEYRVAALNRR
jgi:hypothetical protein